MLLQCRSKIHKTLPALALRLTAQAVTQQKIMTKKAQVHWSLGVAARHTNEGGGHLEALGRNVTHRALHIVGDPLHKVGGVLVLHIQHLLIHFLCRHPATEDCRCCQVSPMTRVSSAHHVLGIPHLLSQLGDRQSPAQKHPPVLLV